MKREKLKIKVQRCDYHRNGITGISFYAVWFTYTEDGIKESAVATVDADQVEKERCGGAQNYNPGTRVLMLDEVGGVDLQRTMRGDHFHKELCEWIIKEKK